MTTQGDGFKNLQVSLESPLSHSEAANITSADHEFSYVTRAILVTGAGDLVMRLANDGADLTLTVAAGTFLPLRISHIRMTGTTAAVLGFW